MFSDSASLIRFAEKIRRDIGQCHSIDGLEIQISASVGLAVYPGAGDRYDALLQHADAAMFRDNPAHRAASRLCEMNEIASAANRQRPTPTPCTLCERAACLPVRPPRRRSGRRDVRALIEHEFNKP